MKYWKIPTAAKATTFQQEIDEENTKLSSKMRLKSGNAYRLKIMLMYINQIWAINGTNGIHQISTRLPEHQTTFTTLHPMRIVGHVMSVDTVQSQHKQ